MGDTSDLGQNLMYADCYNTRFYDNDRSYEGSEHPDHQPSGPPHLLPLPTTDLYSEPLTPAPLHECSSPDMPPQLQQSGGTVARRNERERKRVRMVNMGFAKLRQYVPLATRGKRLSKVETLRSAIDYIRQLRQLLIYHHQRVEEPRTQYFHHHPLYDPRAFGLPPRSYGYFQQESMVPVFSNNTMDTTAITEQGSAVACLWTASDQSPSHSVESDVASSPSVYGIPDGDQTVCWAV